MFWITRHLGQSVFVDLSEDVDPSTPVGELFDQPLEIRYAHRHGARIGLAIEANRGLEIYPDEPAEKEAVPVFGAIDRLR
jgi:hypothetical protein